MLKVFVYINFLAGTFGAQKISPLLFLDKIRQKSRLLKNTLKSTRHLLPRKEAARLT
jgi:hypothetical protein